MRHYNEAHNEYIQLPTEGGWLLMRLVIGTVFALGRGILNRSRAGLPRTKLMFTAGRRDARLDRDRTLIPVFV